MIKAFSVNFASRIYISLTILGISVITARLLSLEQRGQFALFINLINILSMVLGLSMSDSLFNPSLSKKSLVEVISGAYWVMLILCVISFVPILVYINSSNIVVGILNTFIVVFAIFLQILEGVVRSISIKQGFLSRFNLISMLGRTLALLGTVAVCFLYKSPIIVIVCMAVGLLISNLLSLHKMLLLRGLLPSFKSSKQVLKHSIPIHLGLVGAAILSQADQIIVGIHDSRPQLAYYQIAAQIISLLLIIPQSAGAVIYTMLAKSDNYNSQRLALRYLFLGLLTSSAMIVFLKLTSHSLISFIFGKSYDISSVYVDKMSLILLGSVTMTIMGPFWVALGLAKINSVFTAMCAAFFVITSYFLYPRGGIDSMITVLVASYLAMALFNILFWVYKSLSSNEVRLT